MQMLPNHPVGRSSSEFEPLFKYEKGLQIRNMCIAGMVVSYFLGVAAFAASISLYMKDPDAEFTAGRGWSKSTSLSTSSRFAVDLSLNSVIAICTESLGYIHSTSLRWALWREGKLVYSSNIRLLTPASRSRLNSWYSNALFCFALIATYAAASQVLVKQDWGGIWPRPYNGEGTEINGFALLILGIGLLMQALITNACFIRQYCIPTWSSNVLVITSACLADGQGLHRREGRCMLSAFDNLNNISGPSLPKNLQPSLRSTDASVRHITRFLWSLPIVSLIWAIFTSVIKHRSVFLTEYNISSHVYGFLMIAGFQAFLTMGLHATELLVNRSHDEVLWRQAADRRRGKSPVWSWKATGALLKNNSTLAALTSWQYVTLFALKPVTHWFFGNSISLSTGEFVTATLDPLWTFGLAAAALLVALLGYSLASWCP